jgi:hypothetical protein
MTVFHEEPKRSIIEDFAKAISEKRTTGSAPKKTVINFRDWRSIGRESEIYTVPIDLLRYRKENGRIQDEVLSYESASFKILDEKETETQDILRLFLEKDDPEKTKILIKSIKKDGQHEPAIITCDGFLINGNRRKMALEKLAEEDPSQFSTMKVVILPSDQDEGGAPTLKEIELLENRYQLQRDGRSDYSGLNRALSIRRKEKTGITLEDQLLDDSQFAGFSKNSKEFRKAVSEHQKEYSLPLEKVDEYLDSLGRNNQYTTIRDKWQAFIDYSNFYNGKLQEDKWQIYSNIAEGQIGDIQDVAFKIIRKQKIKGREVKLHKIMRDLSKLLANNESKDSLFILNDSIVDLNDREKLDQSGDELPFDKQDLIWGSKNEEIFARAVNTAYNSLDAQKETESSLSLLTAAYKKLIHENMIVENIQEKDLKEFLDCSQLIIEEATELKKSAWSRMKKQ